jgi:hypothetical protein
MYNYIYTTFDLRLLPLGFPCNLHSREHVNKTNTGFWCLILQRLLYWLCNLPTAIPALYSRCNTKSSGVSPLTICKWRLRVCPLWLNTSGRVSGRTDCCSGKAEDLCSERLRNKILPLLPATQISRFLLISFRDMCCWNFLHNTTAFGKFFWIRRWAPAWLHTVVTLSWRWAHGEISG